MAGFLLRRENAKIQKSRNRKIESRNRKFENRDKMENLEIENNKKC